MPEIRITECPRDAMQGLSDFVPTDIKAAYINRLLQVGFDMIDFGSFVSPKAIPQMRDTAEVLAKLDLEHTRSKLLAIVANYRGAETAAAHEQISFLGYPFSLSETFQQRNANTTMAKAFDDVKRINELCDNNNKSLLIYLSMGFGNPYGDEWNQEIVQNWAQQLIDEGIGYISLADTVGIATPEQISSLYPAVKQLSAITSFGLHLHSGPDTWQEKIMAAYESGCTRFDTALKGYGGCPMAKDELTGNIATENLIAFLLHQNSDPGLDLDKLTEAMDFSAKVFE